jgi:hypothetical protein
MAWTKIHLALGTAALGLIALQGAKIVNQHKETVALQAQLQQAAQQSEKQLASIQELETRTGELKTQNEQMVQAFRNAARQSTQSAARKPAAPAPSPMAVAAANRAAVSPQGKGVGSMLKDMMKDPDYVNLIKAIGDQQAQMLKKQYAPLVKQLNLTPEQGDAFYALIMNNATNTTAQGLELMNDTNRAGVISAIADTQKSFQDQMRSFLGDAGFAQFQEYETTIPDRQLLEQMKTSFADNPLTDDQEQRLLQLMVAARKDSGAPIDPATGKPALAGTDRVAQAEQTIQIQDQVDQRVYQQAADFLSPAQLQSLGNSQTNMLGLMKSMMPMMQELMGTDTKSGQ